ncbi:uncharacterized protein K444DRAFT_74148 [Hyaloscypha bicolor E]|uniref:Uncharacterized protein n=1 Tax=Hyaloscypha bicolor E TaxID=1095630 RepID=A0A2J6SXW8_9HELO|nr:uncharacterized protein K444DRAFT_74148 [Hyaloscypha bicolor E]PMD55601.1 hypothetical protein K444DRAFT_74148 [Hyaloscypha bicolor E]
MFSPTAIKDFVAIMNTKGSPLVPNFIFPLNNKSSSPNPRKEAFKFRDGIIIVSTPILSESNAYKCLQKACHAFCVEPPLPRDMSPIIQGTTAKESIEHAKEVEEVIKRTRREPDSARLVEWKSQHLSYFDCHRPSSSSKAEQPMLLVHPSPSDHENATTEHIEDKAVTDTTDWQDRLVPSAKMENARRKHVALLIERSIQARMEIGKGKAVDEGEMPIPAGPVLLRRDGQWRQMALPEGLPESNIRVVTWRRDDAWRRDVARELRLAQREAERKAAYVAGKSSQNGPTSSSHNAGSWQVVEKRNSQTSRRAGYENVRIWDDKGDPYSVLQKSGVEKGIKEDIGPADKSSQWRPTKILSRNDPMSQSEAVESKPQDLQREVREGIRNVEDTKGKGRQSF